jgi:hypothetical protein
LPSVSFGVSTRTQHTGFLFLVYYNLIAASRLSLADCAALGPGTAALDRPIEDNTKKQLGDAPTDDDLAGAALTARAVVATIGKGGKAPAATFLPPGERSSAR